MADSVLTHLLRRPLITLLAGCSLLWIGLSNHHLWAPDELRVGGIGLEMWKRGSWAVPYLGEEPFLEQPPLYYWVEAAFFRCLGGTTTGLARSASALFASLAVLLTYWLGRRFFSKSACLLGCLALITTRLFFVTAQKAMVDNALLFGTTGALACFAHAEGLGSLPEKRWPRRACLAGLYLFLLAAFFSKGVVGMGIPALGMFAYLLWTGRWRPFLGWHLLWGALGMAAAVGLWLFFLWKDGGEAYLRLFLVENQLHRLFPGDEYTGGHEKQPIWYYLTKLPQDLIPWSPLYLLVAWMAWKRLRAAPPLNLKGSDPENAGLRFCLSASAPAFLALSLAGTKRGLYLLPIFPSLALLAGAWMDWQVEEARWERIFHRLVWTWILLFGAGAAAAVVWLDGSRWPFAAGAAACYAALAWFLLRSVRGAGKAPRWLAALILAMVGLGFYFYSWYPAENKRKSFVPAIEKLVASIPAGEKIYAYEPSEALRGAIPFYGGRAVTLVGAAEELAALIRDGRSVWLVVEDSRRAPRNLNALQEAGVPHQVLIEWPLDDRHLVRVLKVSRSGASPDGALQGGGER